MSRVGIHLGVDPNVSREVAHLQHASVIQHQASGLDHDPLHAIYDLVDLIDPAFDQDRVVHRGAQLDAGLDHHAACLA